ncbi:hypothetical protein Ancab_003182 [Ancistrocladus abbreviatus]
MKVGLVGVNRPGPVRKPTVVGGLEAQSSDSMNMVLGRLRNKRKCGGSRLMATNEEIHREAQRCRLVQSVLAPTSNCEAGGAGLAPSTPTEKSCSHSESAETVNCEVEERRSKPSSPANMAAMLRSTNVLKPDSMGAEQIWEMGKELGLKFAGDESTIKK